MKIQVTQEHIDNSERHYTECPVAKAIKARFPTDTSVSVGALRILIACPDGTELKYVTPTYVTKFIIDYDIGHSVSPFSFELGPI